MKLLIAMVAAATGFFAARVMPEGAATPSAAETERVTGIGGIFFKSQDPAKLGAWYRENLGVNVMPGPMVMSIFEWRPVDDSKHVGNTLWSLFRADTKYFEPSRASFMINYRVRNLDKMLEQLRKHGVAVEDKISKDSNGRFAWLMDPEGNRIELWEPAEDH